MPENRSRTPRHTLRLRRSQHSCGDDQPSVGAGRFDVPCAWTPLSRGGEGHEGQTPPRLALEREHSSPQHLPRPLRVVAPVAHSARTPVATERRISRCAAALPLLELLQVCVAYEEAAPACERPFEDDHAHLRARAVVVQHVGSRAVRVNRCIRSPAQQDCTAIDLECDPSIGKAQAELCVPCAARHHDRQPHCVEILPP